jgi:hypothetical protein
VLEQLLWQGDRKPSRGQWSWLRQWLLTAVLGLVELQLEDIRCQYVVPGQLGPEAVQQQHAGQRDGIAVSIRSLALTPGMAVTAEATPGAASSSASANASAAAGKYEGAPAAGERRRRLNTRCAVQQQYSCKTCSSCKLVYGLCWLQVQETTCANS